jgi:signal transduction histidine kinase
MTATAGPAPATALPAPTALPEPPRRLWLLIAAACLVPAVLDAFQTYLQGQLAGGDGPPPVRFILWQGTEWLILGALTPITYYLGRRFPLRRGRLARNVAVHVVGAMVLCVGWAAAGASLRYALHLQPEGQPFAANLASWTLTSVPWSVFMYFTVLGSVHAFAYFFEARAREAQAARLAAQLAEARLGALQMQLHPHFLFNSLNAITVLVRDRHTEQAERMLELLSDALRRVLRGDPNGGGAGGDHEVALGEELAFVREYLAIEQVRFSDRLRVTWAVDESLAGALVPGFVLQPLVENALRHGLARRREAGALQIGARREGDALVLWVRDDGVGLEERGVQEGVGLANTRERLRTLYGDRARLELAPAPAGARGTVATVRLPLRTRAGGTPHA